MVNYELAKEVKALDDYKLHITFTDNSERLYDVKPLLNHNIFKQLKNKELFYQVKINDGYVVWNDILDLAPELIYNNSVILK